MPINAQFHGAFAMSSEPLGDILWNQFGAAIDTLEAAIRACPAEVWGDKPGFHEFWCIAHHAIFWTDYYLSEKPEGFAPPAPFGMEEMDPEGVLPARVYAPAELLAYLAHTRAKARAALANFTPERAAERFKSAWMDFSRTELHLYNMRHVQHHAAQLNLILRQRTESAPGWVARARN